VTRAATPKLAGYVALAVLGLFAGVALGRVELIAVAAPFALIVAVGLATAETPRLLPAARMTRSRLLEGDEAEVTLTLRAETRVERLEVALSVPRGVDATGDASFAVALTPGEERELVVPLRFPRWGAYQAGRMALAAFDRFGLFVFERAVDARLAVRVYPREERLRELVRPRNTQPYVGNLVARQKGEGVEFADIRPYAPGDRVRSINWRATARRGSLVVNEQHPERNASVVLLVDSFAEARLGGAGTLDQAVRATASLARAYLARRDQVGVLSFGGTVNWLEPTMGTRQVYKIVEALVDTEIVLSYVWRDIGVIPARVLPPQALVLALTPVLDDRMVDALADVRGRGADVAVVEIVPEPFLATPEGERAELARRIWELRRAATRGRFRRLGMPVVQWRSGDPLEPVLEEVSAFRRYARAMHA
jgi:uncharacterized protein (DUF58 family)